MLCLQPDTIEVSMRNRAANKRKWAGILAAQIRDSASIAAGQLQKPATESKSHAKAGKRELKALKNERFATTGERIFSTSQGAWVHAPNWYKK